MYLLTQNFYESTFFGQKQTQGGPTVSSVKNLFYFIHDMVINEVNLGHKRFLTE
jgi:hypothetical protein